MAIEDNRFMYGKYVQPSIIFCKLVDCLIHLRYIFGMPVFILKIYSVGISTVMSHDFSGYTSYFHHSNLFALALAILFENNALLFITLSR